MLSKTLLQFSRLRPLILGLANEISTGLVHLRRPPGQPRRPSSVRGACRQPARTLGDPLLARSSLMGLGKLIEDPSQSDESLQLLAHDPDRVVDVAVGADRLPELTDLHV